MIPGIDATEATDLFLQRDELIPFLGVAGNGDAAIIKYFLCPGFRNQRAIIK